MPKTKVKQKQLYENRNTSDVFSRLVIMGLLRVLNKKLIYQQVWHDDEDGIENIVVPFFYDFTGGSVTSERFIQDNYTAWTDDECTSMGIKKMDGDYKPIPFGIISLGSTAIDAGNISNRFVMGRYTKKVGSELKSFVSFLYSIPLTYSFTATIKCDTMNTMWKIEQAFREYFYKNKTYHINYKGTVVPVRVGFPESISSEKTAQYQVGTQNDGFDIKLSFDISCETYQPVFDPYSEIAAEHQMKGWTYPTSIDGNRPIDQGNIQAITNLNGLTLTVDQEILLEWKYNYEFSDLISVELLYKIEGDETEHLIEIVNNNNFYHLVIPAEIFNEQQMLFDIQIPNTDTCTVQTQPVIRVIPDSETGVISKNSFVILNKGFFLTKEKQVEGIVSYEDKRGKIIDTIVKFNLVNGMIDENNPVTMRDFIYRGELVKKRIILMVRDAFNKNKFDYFSKDNEGKPKYITII